MHNWFKIILFFLICQQWAYSQQPAYFLFGQDQFEGIDIYNIIQDFDHNYWFATDQGLYMHDGYNFERVESDKMKASSVFNFVIDSQGVIYCSNLSQQVFKIENGICSLIFEIPDTGTDLHLVVNREDELYISTSRKAYVLNKKHELIHTPEIQNGFTLGPPFLLENGSVVQHVSDDAQLLSYANGVSGFESLTNFIDHNDGDDILHFFQMDETIYCVNNLDKEIFKFDSTSYSIEQTNKKIEAETSLLRYYAIDNSLWVSNNIFGVFLLNDKLEKTHKSAKIFNDYFISYVYQDHEKNILLGTFDQGVIVIPNKEIEDVIPLFSDYKVKRIIKGSENELILGTRDGGVLKYDDGQLAHISTSSNKSVEHLFYWPNHQLVFEDTNELNVHFPDKKPISLGFGSLKNAISISENELMLALNSGLVTISFDPKTKTFQKDSVLISERTYCLARENNSKNTYVSTASGLRYSDGNSDYNLVNHEGQNLHILNLTAYQDKIIASSSRSGIFLLRNGKVLEKINPIFNEVPLTIFKLIIEENRIYANTQMGLFILNMEGEIINILNKSNGLIANKIIDFELFKNQLWVTHAKGIQYFDLKNVNTEVSKPVILLSDIFINNERIENISEVGKFNSEERNFKFSFQVPTLRYRENVRYHFKLEGYLNDWSINNYENHEVEYNALAPGIYRFVVKAENNGVFSEPIYYSFTISTPFYMRWWFAVLVVLVLILIISAIYKRQLNIQKVKADQINELNASRLTAIQSQMNPHFIFNALNSIQDLVLKGDIDNSYNFITKFSNLVRRTLNYSDKDFIDFEEEIKLIELYLSLEKLRLKESLKYTINTNGIEDIHIPPMLIQPFIENALVHGLLHKAGEKLLTINFEFDEVLICEIIDNGIGREKAQEIKNRQGNRHESFAINAIKRRFSILMSHYDGELGFIMEDIILNEEVKGTKVTLRIPVQLKF